MNMKSKILLIIVLLEMVLVDLLMTIKFTNSYEKIKELEERVKQLEIDCKLYEYDFEQLREYKY